ncbi:MAG: L,D-transpeptidase family protein [Prosthecobacter sp.]
MIHRLLKCFSGVIMLGSLLLSAAHANDLLASKSAQVDAPEMMVRRALPAGSSSLISPSVPPPAKPADVVVKPFQKKTRVPRGISTWKVFQDDVTELFRTEIPDIGELPLLHYAVLLDDAEWVSELIAKGADPNEMTPGGDTLLCTAARFGALNSARALLYGGAVVSQPGYEKQPPLALASLRRGTDMLRALIAAGADPNTRFVSPPTKAFLDRVTIKDLRNTLEDDRGITPLIACASRGDVEGAAELLRAGASPSKCTTRYHRYPINFAATQGYIFLMRIILGRQPESEPEILVTIDLSKQRAWVVKEGRVIDTCSVSTGREGFRTPAGRYVITDKHRSWTSTLYHVAMPYFMRLNCSAIGMHSGHVTGSPASHGCIRLPYEKAQKFFGICRVGDEVQIVY